MKCDTCQFGDHDAGCEPCLSCAFDADTGTMTNYKASHYTARGGIEPIQFIMSNNLSFAEGCIVKYIYRYRYKGGLSDLYKARQYLDWLIERCENEAKRLENEVDDDGNYDASVASQD